MSCGNKIDDDDDEGWFRPLSYMSNKERRVLSIENDLTKGIVFKRENGEPGEKAIARLMLLVPWIPLATARVSLSSAECNGGRMNVFEDRIQVAPRGMRNNIERLRQCGFTSRARGNGVYTLTRETVERMAVKAAVEAEARKPENVRVYSVRYLDKTLATPLRKTAISMAAFALSDPDKKIDSVEIVTLDGNDAVLRREAVRFSIDVTFEAEQP